MSKSNPFKGSQSSPEIIRLAVILHRIWVDGTEFRGSRDEVEGRAA